MISVLAVGVLLPGCGAKNEAPEQETVSEQETAFTFLHGDYRITNLTTEQGFRKRSYGIKSAESDYINK